MAWKFKRDTNMRQFIQILVHWYNTKMNVMMSCSNAVRFMRQAYSMIELYKSAFCIFKSLEIALNIILIYLNTLEHS